MQYRPRLGLVGALALSAMGGCGSPTQLVVIVDSDLEAGTELAAVEVGVGSRTHRFDLEQHALPLSLGVARGERDEVSIIARGFGPGGAEVVSHRVDTRFVEGRVIRVDAPLSRACTWTECEDACRDGECVGAFRDPADLPDDDGGDPPSLFDDAPPPPDAGPPPVECEGEGEPCGEPCHPGTTVCDPEPRCERGAPIGAGESCGEGRTCDAEGRCGG